MLIVDRPAPFDPRGAQGPCMAAWAPRTCRSLATSPATRWRYPPSDHLCMEPVAFPHVCRCTRCGDGAAR